MDFANYWFSSGSGGGGGYQIGNSLRFRKGQRLAATNSGSSDNYLFSLWVKRGSLIGVSTGGCIFGRGSDNKARFEFTDDALYTNNSGGGTSSSASLYRDPSAWYHIVFKRSTALNVNRLYVWVNGQVVYRTNGNAYLDTPGALLSNTKIGATGSNTRQFDGYMAEIHAIDGANGNINGIEYTDFGEFNADGVWVPKEVSLSTADYGSAGFYLDFSDPANIGADRSGNGNNFTPTGFELTNTTSTTYDWMADSPTDNFATINPLGTAMSRTGTISEANLRLITNTSRITGSTLLPKVKCYWEDFVIRGGGSNNGFGIVDISSYKDTQGSLYYKASGRVYINNVVQPGTYASLVNNVTTIGWTYDPDTDEVGIRIDNVFQDTITLVTTTGVGQWAPVITSGGAVNTEGQTNFGQRPFKYTPPAGFEPLSTAVQPDVDITNPSDHCQVFLAGSQSGDSNYIKNEFTSTFANGMLLWRTVAGGNGWYLSDTVRGFNNVLKTNDVIQEAAQTNPSNTGPAFGYGWSAPDTFTGGGSIASSGRRNTTAGFSIVSYKGSGAAGTVGHGLPSAPQMVWFKRRNGANAGWVVGSDFIPPGDWTYYAQLNTTNNRTIATNVFNGVPTASDLKIGTNAIINASGSDYIAYCWNAVPGYSAFGNAIANGHEDGPFVYTGFRPAFVITKVIQGGSGGPWFTGNIENSTYNPINGDWRLDDPVPTTANNYVDLLSNGFKWRTRSSGSNNTNGTTIMWMAFAEHPFGGANVSPSPAR